MGCLLEPTLLCLSDGSGDRVAVRLERTMTCGWSESRTRG